MSEHLYIYIDIYINVQTKRSKYILLIKMFQNVIKRLYMTNILKNTYESLNAKKVLHNIYTLYKYIVMLKMHRNASE